LQTTSAPTTTSANDGGIAVTDFLTFSSIQRHLLNTHPSLVIPVEPQAETTRERETTIEPLTAETLQIPENPLGQMGSVTIVQSTPAPEEPVAGPSRTNDDFREILGDLEVPEGVDPSFLAALPEELRQEVISEHLRYKS